MGRIAQNSDSPNLVCKFSHPKCNPETITLPIGPNGVTWEYVLNSNTIDTYGGQVVQILGVSVQNFKITGMFGGIDPQWGIDKRDETPNTRNRPMWTNRARKGEFQWINTPSVTNGIRQMSDWFRQYFMIATQGVANARTFEAFDERVMWFDFPARNWHIPIRPRSFPKTRVANDEIAPEWIVEADFVERFESSREFIEDVSQLARNRLNDLKVGIGFKRRNPFSEFVPEAISSEELATSLVETYQESVLRNFSEDEINELITLGFSYMPGVYQRAGFEGS